MGFSWPVIEQETIKKRNDTLVKLYLHPESHQHRSINTESFNTRYK